LALEKEEINNIVKNIIKTLLTIVILTSTTILKAATVGVIYDADYYMYYGSYNDVRTPFYVGVNNLTPGSPYQYHFNVAGLEVGDVSSFNTGDTALLYLDLQRFRVPNVVDPSYQGPPSYTYYTTGQTFTLKVVALTDSFVNISTASDPLAWYQNNLLNRPTIATATFTDAGWKAIDITSAVSQWKAGTLGNNGLGVIGTYSSIEGTTAQFYSTESLYTPYVNIIPEPNVLKYLITGLIVALILRQFAK